VLGFLIRRLVSGFLVIFLISVVTFVIFFKLPTGDPAYRIAGKSPTPELVHQIRVKWHFDDPLPVQYAYMMKQLLTGKIKSYNVGVKIVPLAVHAFPVTLSLCLFAMSIWLSVGIWIGIKGARNPGSTLDNSLTIASVIGFSLPTLWLALLMMLIFTVKLPIFPPGDYVTIGRGGVLGWAYHLVLPACTLAIVSAASYARLTRSSVRQTTSEEWVKTAIAKGIPQGQVFIHHVFRIAMIPLVIMLGMDFAMLLTGAIFTETLFGLPGLGSVLMLGIKNLDFPILLMMTIFGAMLIVIANIIVDIIQASLDPRVRLD
jgi:peptide/nickel transport system permease protein